MTDTARSISALRKRRGVVKASITRLAKTVGDLKDKTGDPKTLGLVQRTIKRLETLDQEFQEHHGNLVVLLDDEHELAREQEVLDTHDEEVAMLAVDLEYVVAACTQTTDSSARKVVSRRVALLKKSLEQVKEDIGRLSGGTDDLCLLRHHEEQLSDAKRDLRDLTTELLALDLKEGDDLMAAHSDMEGVVARCSLELRRLISAIDTRTHSPSPSARSGTHGVKLPKLDVPTFDGNLLGWKSFWEQFSISVHDHTSLSNSEKLVYLQQALKGGSAKSTIEGLSRTGDNYKEAVQSLKTRYDRPRLIHQAHVRVILETPSLKDGSGKELRRLHDAVQQHLRALKSMDYEPSGPFVTSILELKLDQTTLFEWHKHSQSSTSVPHYQELLDFINLRAQASETSVKQFKTDAHALKKTPPAGKGVPSFISVSNSAIALCVLCKTERHPLYACAKFKSLSHDRMVSLLKEHGICMNCLRTGHFVRQCKSQHRCKHCQRPHHSLLHIQEVGDGAPATPADGKPLPTLAAVGFAPNSLLMTCQVLVDAPDGSVVRVRALLDSASSVSFVSERLAQSLCLPRFPHSARISGVAGLVHKSPIQAMTKFNVTATRSSDKKFGVTAVIVPRVTCDLPVHPVTLDPSWDHLRGLQMADPNYGRPGKIDILLGVDVFVGVIRSGRRAGPPNAPVALETEFGWVLAGKTTSPLSPLSHFATHHVSLLSGDELLRQFWEVEENPGRDAVYTTEEQLVVQHFRDNHFRTDSGRFAVPLPRKSDAMPMGESRSQAVRRFFALERSLRSKGQFEEFNVAMREYFDMNHAELVPVLDLEKPPRHVFYLPMHAVRKDSSTTTKIRPVFDASAKSSTGVSLNDTLMVGPTIHPPLFDVLIRFRSYRVALVADVSRMYRAVELVESDRDFHRFVWRSNPEEPLADYRMVRLTFGVSASSFVANMSVKQNAVDLSHQYPLAAAVVDQSFYVDDALTGADSVEDAIELQSELHGMFAEGGFLLRKWNSSEPAVLDRIPPDLKASSPCLSIPCPEQYTKTLGIEWNPGFDHFRLAISQSPLPEGITKRTLVSDVAKTYDVLGWFAPAIVKAKILFQRLWELKVDWDDPVPPSVKDAWLQWRKELPCLSGRHVPRCYYLKEAQVVSLQLHGFSDASECAYGGVVYLRSVDAEGKVHVSLVTAKTKVAPIKRVSIPRLELCGAQLLARLLHHVRDILDVTSSNVFAWTDSTIVLAWLTGNPRRFKTYVGNRVANIVELVAPDRWNHVSGSENPADCASRGLYPSELVNHALWWDGPSWLYSDPCAWPRQSSLPLVHSSCEEKELTFHSALVSRMPIFSLDRYSSFTKMARITAWILRFVHNCRAHSSDLEKRLSLSLSVREVITAEDYWIKFAQQDNFSQEIATIESGRLLAESSCLVPLHPFLDSSGVLRVGGRERNSSREFRSQHPAILNGAHPVTRLVIHTEHLRLLHAGPTLLSSSLNRRFHIVGGRKIVRSITRGCVVCRRDSVRPRPQMMGQLPVERVTPGPVFDKVGVDFAGPINVKFGPVRKPTVVKSYVCVFVSLSVKAVHLEAVSDLTTEAFLASLRRFVARRGKPSLVMSDHGTNFVGANRELRELVEFLSQLQTQGVVSKFCSAQHIDWQFIPERTPHFGGIWEAAVKSLKTHLRKVTANVTLTFEELSTVLTQIEACLNSRPLVPLVSDDDGVEALTPGHFLIGRPIEALPDNAHSYRSISILRRWHLCQALVRRFWTRWSDEYLATLRRYAKWNRTSTNIREGDVVVLHDDGLVPTKWPLGRITKVHRGKDNLVRVVTVKTGSGTYKRPVTKVAPLLPSDT